MKTYAYIAAGLGSPEFQTQYNAIISYASNHSLRGPIEVKHESRNCSQKAPSVLATLIADLSRGDVLVINDYKVLGDTTVVIMTTLSNLSQKGVRVHVIGCGLRIEDNVTAMAISLGCSLVTQIHYELASQSHGFKPQEPTGDLHQYPSPRRIRKSSLDAKKDEIQDLLRDGATFADIARQIGANRQTVADFIVSRDLTCKKSDGICSTNH